MSVLCPDNMSVEIDHKKRRMFFSQWGPINKENIIQSYKLINGIEGFDPSYSTLANFLKITEVDVRFDEFMSIYKETKDIEKRTGRAALLVGKDTGRYFLAKLFCELSAKFSDVKVRFKAFQTVEEAEAWLDSDP